MMEEKLSEQVERCLKAHGRRKRRSRALRVLALVVVFVTVYMLIVPAVTLSNETTCGMEAHTHDESCYELKMVAPQAEMICGAENDADIVIHLHDEYCYDAEGSLICALPEIEGHTHDGDCYQEQQELTCSEAQEQGHTHSDACYARDRGELNCALAEGEGHVHSEDCYTITGGELICTEAESEGHSHDSGCYTVTQSETLTCSESESGDVYDEESGELIESGHSHDSGCYEVEESEELTCTLEESAGHSHGEGCYGQESEELTCTISDGEGHTHGDGCYEWTERLTCTETERETGHVHTDECYSHTEALACTEPETELHTHSDDCYDEDGELVCEKPAVAEHQHTAACFSAPEGEPEEKEVLVCGMEEHTHTDDCYREIIPELGEKYFCGLAEHTHEPDCWFDSGELRCTLPEHLHNADCLDPEKAGVLPTEQGSENAIWIDDTFEYNTDEFNMSFHVRGYAVPEYEVEGELYVSAGRGETALPSASSPEQESEADVEQSIPDTASHAPVRTEDEAEPPAETEPVQPEPTSEPPENGDTGEPETNDAEPEAPRGGEGDDEYDDAVEAPAEPEPAQEVEVSFGIIEEDEDFGDIAFADIEAGESDAFPEYDADGEDEDAGETLLKKSITITAEVDGVKLDLSQCEITAQVTPTEMLISAVGETASMYGDMYYDPYMTETGAQIEGEQAEIVMTVASEGNVLASANIAEGESAETELPENKFEITVSSQANPTFTVEYYAKLSTVDSRKENATASSLEVIDTSGGSLPVNGGGTNPPTENALREMYLNENGEVLMRTDVQPVYRTHKFKYASAPGLQYINIIGDKVMNESAGGNLLKNYSLCEIWIQLGDNEQVPDGARVESEYVQDENGVERMVRWKVVDYNDSVRLTNLSSTAEKNPNCILIENDAVIRLVYDTTNDPNHTEEGIFYDYDISDGPNNATVMKNDSNGLNDYTHDNGKSHYAFGNSNAGVTAWQEQEWNGNYLNKRNRYGSDDRTFGGCTFGIVKGYDTVTENVIFSDGIEGPKLFGTEDVKGKTAYENSNLTFQRKGDTYTLSSVAVQGSRLSSLERFVHPQEKYSNIWTNNFWPMDGVQNADPHFGGSDVVKYGQGDWDRMPTSDDGKPHNAYFGLHFSVTFELTEDYIGPLEYWFFGDDDMWVFLSDSDEDGNAVSEAQLICDIGGLHSSVGEYVDLWDYVGFDDGPGKNEEIVDMTKGEGEGNARSKKYRLDFFYTERGASGSTCWMQFTLPTLAGVNLEDTIKTKVDEDHGALWIEKEVESPIPDDIYRDFTFKFELEGGENVSVDDSYIAYIRTVSGDVRPYGEDGSGAITKDAIFTLKHGEALAITNLPKDATYTITEVIDYDIEPEFTTTVDTKVEYLERHEKYGDDPYVTGPVETVIATGPVEGATMTTVHYVNKSTAEVSPPFGEGDTGVLWLEKKVEGVRSDNKFKFEISLDFNGVEDKKRFLYENTDFEWKGADAEPLNGTYKAHVYIRSELTNGEFIESGDSAELDVNGLKASIVVNLKDGEAIAITSLPPGTTYTVTENAKVFENFNVHYIKSFEAFEHPDDSEAVKDSDAPQDGQPPEAEGAEVTDTGAGELEQAEQYEPLDMQKLSADTTEPGVETPNGEENAGDTDTTGEAEVSGTLPSQETTDEPSEETIYGEAVSGQVEAGRTDKLVCVNSARYTFPETGASIENSAMMYTLAGVLLTMAACCLWYRKKAVRGGG